MLKYYITTTIRNLAKRPFFLIINMAGLTVAVLISTLIALYVHAELSADQDMAISKDTYRVLRKSFRNNEGYRIGVTSGPFAEALVNDFPVEIAAALRVYPNNGLISINEEKHYEEDKLYLADSNFFSFFNYDFIYGDAETAFAQPQSLVLTDDVAMRLFGKEDPRGKVLEVNQTFRYTVTGVVKRPKNKTHLDFNVLTTIDVLRNYEFFNEWWSNGLVTYVQLTEEADPATLDEKFPGFMDKYFGEDFRESGLRTDLTLQHFDQVYFENDVQYDRYVHGNLETVYIFIIVGVFIIIIACINFMNITTAMASLRAREVGIKKILGSSKQQLIRQYILEAFIICSTAVLLGFMSVEILLPYFNEAYSLSLTIQWFSIEMITYTIFIMFALVAIAGIYPALLLSAFNPLKVIASKGKTANLAATWVRKGLVVFQFACSIVMLITTAVVWQQMQYVLDKPLGFDQEHVVLIRNSNQDIRDNRELFAERVRQVPGVKSVSSTAGEPGGFHDTMNFKIVGIEDTKRMRTTFSDAHYAAVFGIELMEGRFFRDNNPLDTERAMVLNETAVKRLGLTNSAAIGLQLQNLYVDTLYREVVGVVKDYHFTSLKNDMEPLAISPSNYYRRIAIKIDGEQMAGALKNIEQIYKGLVDHYPFEYEFVDENIGALYQEEQTRKSIFMVFSIASVFIGCLGIFGLATFTANQRSREISIRKVLGASISSISMMLGNQFVKLVFVANVVAWPIAWYFMKSWLSGFAYRIDLPVLTFFGAAAIAVVIAVLAVSYQSLKAATSNPAITLRND